jgi:hypothetical protein
MCSKPQKSPIPSFNRTTLLAFKELSSLSFSDKFFSNLHSPSIIKYK